MERDQKSRIEDRETAFDVVFDGEGASTDRLPVAIPGMDLQMFKNYWMRALGGDDGVPPSILTFMWQPNGTAKEDPRERSDREWRQLYAQYAVQKSLQRMNEMIGRYNQMADFHHDEAEKARARMREATDKLVELNEFLEGADDIFKKMEETGKFDRERAIELLKKRGVEVDPNEDDQALKNRLAMEQRKAKTEQSQWSQRYEQAKTDSDYHDEQERENRRKAGELVKRRDEIQARYHDDPEAEQREIVKANDQYAYDIQCKADSMEKKLREEAQELIQRRDDIQARNHNDPDGTRRDLETLLEGYSSDAQRMAERIEKEAKPASEMDAAAKRTERLHKAEEQNDDESSDFTALFNSLSARGDSQADAQVNLTQERSRVAAPGL